MTKYSFDVSKNLVLHKITELSSYSSEPQFFYSQGNKYKSMVPDSRQHLPITLKEIGSKLFPDVFVVPIENSKGAKQFFSLIPHICKVPFMKKDLCHIS